MLFPATLTGPLNPDKLVLPDDIVSYHDTNIPFPFTENAQDILCNIRCPESPPNPVTDTEIALSASSALGNVAITWDRVKLATASDATMNQLISTIESGFPEFRHELPNDCKSTSNSETTCTPLMALLYKELVVIPPALRQQILMFLHSAQQGVTSMTARVETTVFWPGITTAIMSTRKNCNHCNCMAPSQPSAPPYPPVQPTYPFHIC